MLQRSVCHSCLAFFISLCRLLVLSFCLSVILFWHSTFWGCVIIVCMYCRSILGYLLFMSVFLTFLSSNYKGLSIGLFSPVRHSCLSFWLSDLHVITICLLSIVLSFLSVFLTFWSCYNGLSIGLFLSICRSCLSFWFSCYNSLSIAYLFHPLCIHSTVQGISPTICKEKYRIPAGPTVSCRCI